jgi:hypothetical protein
LYIYLSQCGLLEPAGPAVPSAAAGTAKAARTLIRIHSRKQSRKQSLTPSHKHTYTHSITHLKQK